MEPGARKVSKEEMMLNEATRLMPGAGAAQTVRSPAPGPAMLQLRWYCCRAWHGGVVPGQLCIGGIHLHGLILRWIHLHGFIWRWIHLHGLHGGGHAPGPGAMAMGSLACLLPDGAGNGPPPPPLRPRGPRNHLPI